MGEEEGSHYCLKGKSSSGAEEGLLTLFQRARKGEGEALTKMLVKLCSQGDKARRGFLNPCEKKPGKGKLEKK